MADIKQHANIYLYCTYSSSYEGHCIDTMAMQDQMMGGKLTTVRELPSPSEFALALDGIDQLWILSSYHLHLSDQHIEVIMSRWLDGMHLFLWGDNDPYYQEANQLLKQVYSLLSHKTHEEITRNSCPKLLGSTIGDGHVQTKLDFAEHMKNHHDLFLLNDLLGIVTEYCGLTGFLHHPVFDGIEKLHEGHTVAHVEGMSMLEDIGFRVLLRDGTDHQPIFIMRSKTNQHEGKIAIHGGFTMLFVDYMRSLPTSRQFVMNTYRFLGMKANRDPPLLCGHLPIVQA